MFEKNASSFGWRIFQKKSAGEKWVVESGGFVGELVVLAREFFLDFSGGKCAKVRKWFKVSREMLGVFEVIEIKVAKEKSLRGKFGRHVGCHCWLAQQCGSELDATLLDEPNPVRLKI